MVRRKQRTERLTPTGLDPVVANLIACGIKATADHRQRGPMTRLANQRTVTTTSGHPQRTDP